MKSKTFLQLLGLTLVSALLVHASPIAPKRPAWQKWAENPNLLKLVITGNFEAASNTPCAIHIAGLNRTNLGVSCSISTNFSTVITYLKPYQPYKLTLTGDSVYFAHLDLLAPTV